MSEETKEWFEFSKEELLKLPKREWYKTSSYNSILFVNTRMKHDSGYNLFAIIGCEDGNHPTEICGFMDDFRFDTFQLNNEFTDVISTSDIAFDCSMKGVFRMHSRRKIHVGSCCSTTNWWLGEKI